ncbi:MAG: amino acid adenylation domain-containing protein, partial [bacterium]|nr:amino acid adenylation domain-containing protein [bacterium]
MFINTLPIRNNPEGKKTFTAFLQEVREQTLGALENQDYPFEELVENITGIQRDTSRNPMFDVMLTMQKTEIPEVCIPGLNLKPYRRESRTSKFDLMLSAAHDTPELRFGFEYATKLFKKETIQRFITYFKKIISGVIHQPDSRLGEIEILTPQEKKQLQNQFNDTKADYPGDKTIHQLFEEQVEKTPDRISIVGSRQLAVGKEKIKGKKEIKDNKETKEQMGAMDHVIQDAALNVGGIHESPMIHTQQITYRELNENANRAAAKLIRKGVTTGTIVAIMETKSIRLLTAILAILKAGGAYLPIDPEAPEERVNYMLKDSNTALLVTNKTITAKINYKKEIIKPQEIIQPQEITGTKENELTPEPQTRNRQTANGIAYIIYTSGTTGKPKGVMIQHNNLVRLFVNSRNPFDFESSDTWTMFHSQCFDFSVWEMYGAMTSGGKLVVIPPEEARDTAHYLQELKKQQVTVLNQTPSAFYNLINQELLQEKKELQIRYVIFGGEALTPGKLKQWQEKYPETRLINMFGITETTVHVTYKEITGETIRKNRCNIGKPIPTLTTKILNTQQNHVPIGVPGELYVGGEGVARGYMNQPELTAEKFITTNKYPLTGTRLYRTGDQARYMQNGEMEYMGRLDHQVQLRGYRIELGEIESKLLTHKTVKEAVVLARGEDTGDKYLCAYVVTTHLEPTPLEPTPLDLDTGQEQGESLPQNLREYLAQKLPDYMVPAFILPLEHIPLTVNGKVDRRALPEPVIKATGTYVAPRTGIERQLTGIWTEILKRKGEIGIDDDFFQLGGHSLKATTMASRIHKELNVKVPLSEIFGTRTIRGLARYVETAAEERYRAIEPAEKKEYYPLSSAQKRLYILQQMETGYTGYNMPTMAILEGHLERPRLQAAFAKVIRGHESFRTTFFMRGEEPVQRIHDNVAFEIESYETECKGQSPENADRIIKNFVRPFELTRAPLMRVGLLKLEEQPVTPEAACTGRHEKHLLMMDLHHIITDGTSMHLLTNRVMSAYAGQESSRLRLQYRDYSEWWNRLYQKGELKPQEDWWLKQYEEEPAALSLPFDYPRPEVQAFEGRNILFQLTPGETLRLQEIAGKRGVTLFVLLLAAANILLARLGDQEDIVIGTPVAGRRNIDLEPVIGMFANTLAIRSKPGGKKRVTQYLEEIKNVVLSAFENQDYPFEELVDRVVSTRDVGRNPLFDVMFVFQNMDITGGLREIEEAGLTLKLYRDFEIAVSQFDLYLIGYETQDYLTFRMGYSTRLFKEDTARRIIEYYKNILAALPEEGDMKINEIRLTHDLIETEPEELDIEFGF